MQRNLISRITNSVISPLFNEKADVLLYVYYALNCFM